MGIFDEQNEDALSISPDAAATGPRVGFLQNFEDSYNMQVRGSAMYGIEKAMHELDYEQVQAMRSAGIEDVPKLSDNAFGFFGSGAFSGDYMDTAKFYEDGGDPDVANQLKAYDDKVNSIREKYPNLRVLSSREMWDDVKAKAQQSEKKSETNRTTFAGSVGGFLGGAVGGLNPESDPLNFATMPLNAGRSVLGRIGFQGAAQGVVEGINQVTGVQDQRRLLGLDTGFADGLTRVAGAAIGGAAIQGIGEGTGALARRFFRNTPSDPAPRFEPPSRPAPVDVSAVPRGAIPADEVVGAAKLQAEPTSYMDYLQQVSPWSVSRQGKQRTVLDLDYATKSLNDWNGETPVNLRPLTLATQAVTRGDYTAPQPNIFDRVAASSTVDSVARQIDPDTFRIYDKHADDKAWYSNMLETLKPEREQAAEARLTEINNRIDDLKEKADRSGAMKAKKIGKEIAELTAERDAVKQEMLTTDTPDMARIRQHLIRNDEKMRELAPVVSRAYARARNKWDNTEADRQALREMVRNGSKTVGTAPDGNTGTFVVPESIYDKAPLLKQASSIKGKLPDRADAATVANHVLAEQSKVLDEVTETFRASLGKVVAKDAKNEAGEAIKEIEIPGQKYKLRLDEDVIVDEDGQSLTVRQYLQKHVDSEEDLKAVTSCSIL